jgi:chorismate mutase
LAFQGTGDRQPADAGLIERNAVPATTSLPAETSASAGAASAAVPSAEPGAVSVDELAAVETLRTQIDALDTAIAQLITERARLSRRVQAARLNAGGPRVELGRERAIYAHYRGTLGGVGGAVAEAILRVCRG